MSIDIAQRSFTGGEWSPSLFKRSDLEKYATAVRRMRNFFPHPHGGTSKRGGSDFIDMVKANTYYGATSDEGEYVTLVPFQFSTTQAYVLEFSTTGAAGVLRVLSDGGVVQSGGSDYEGTHGFLKNLQLLRYTQSADVLYLTHPQYAPKKASRLDHDDWAVTNVNFTASVGQPQNLIVTDSPAQPGHDVVYVVTAVGADGSESVRSAVLSAEAGETIGWDAVTNAEYYNVYREVGGLNCGTYGYIGTSGTHGANRTFVEEPIEHLHPNEVETPPAYNNPFATDFPAVCQFYKQRLLFAGTSLFPQTIWGSVVASFENMNRSIPIRDDDSYEFTLDSKQVNDIRWMLPLGNLVVGTGGSEWKMGAAVVGGSITPSSVDLDSQSEWGSSRVQPIIVGKTILFSEPAGKILRDLAYSFDVDGLDSNDITILANHFFKEHKIIDMCYQQSPDSIVWCVREDGALIGLTYYKKQSVWGWFEYETDGDVMQVCSIRNDNGNDDVYMVVKRQGLNQNYNASTAGATDFYCIERMRQALTTTDIKDAFLVDNGFTIEAPQAIEDITLGATTIITITDHGYLDGAYVDFADVVGTIEINNLRFKVANKTDDTFEIVTEGDVSIDSTEYGTFISGVCRQASISWESSGLKHLVGKEVTILADGNVVTGKTVVVGTVDAVNNGKIILDAAASRVHVGAGYSAELETMDFDYQTKTGTVQAKIRSISTVIISVEKTRSLWVGPNAERIDEIPLRTDESYGDPTGMYTGDIVKAIEEGYEREGRLFLYNPDPLPTTILGLVARIEDGYE